MAPGTASEDTRSSGDQVPISALGAKIARGRRQNRLLEELYGPEPEVIVGIAAEPGTSGKKAILPAWLGGDPDYVPLTHLIPLL